MRRERVLWFNTTCSLPVEIRREKWSFSSKQPPCHKHLSLNRDTGWAVIRLPSTSPTPSSSHFFPTPHRVKSDQLRKGLLKTSEPANAYSLYGNRNGKGALGIHKHFFLFNSKLVLEHLKPKGKPLRFLSGHCHPPTQGLKKNIGGPSLTPGDAGFQTCGDNKPECLFIRLQSPPHLISSTGHLGSRVLSHL